MNSISSIYHLITDFYKYNEKDNTNFFKNTKKPFYLKCLNCSKRIFGSLDNQTSWLYHLKFKHPDSYKRFDKKVCESFANSSTEYNQSSTNNLNNHDQVNANNKIIKESSIKEKNIQQESKNQLDHEQVDDDEEIKKVILNQFLDDNYNELTREQLINAIEDRDKHITKHISDNLELKLMLKDANEKLHKLNDLNVKKNEIRSYLEEKLSDPEAVEQLYNEIKNVERVKSQFGTFQYQLNKERLLVKTFREEIEMLNSKLSTLQCILNENKKEKEQLNERITILNLKLSSVNQEQTINRPSSSSTSNKLILLNNGINPKRQRSLDESTTDDNQLNKTNELIINGNSSFKTNLKT